MIDKFEGEHAFLSNFYPCDLVWNEKFYFTLEHAFQAAKANNEEDHEKIRKTIAPGQAKRAGKKIALRSDWEEIKLDIMRELVTIKFSKEPFKTKLKKTNQHELVEANIWNDLFWGIDDKTREGQNWLGKILMEVRNSL